MAEKEYFKYNDITKENLVRIYPTQFGMQRVTGAKNKNVIRDCHVLHIILSGSGIYCASNQKYELKAGQAFLIYPGKVVSYYASEGDPWEYVWIGFEGEDVQKMLEEHGIDKDQEVFELKNTESFKKLVSKLFNKPTGSAEQLMYAQGVLFYYLEDFFKNIKNGHKTSNSESQLKRVVSYIRGHYDDSELTISGICKEMAVNRTSLFKKFKAEYGISPQKYIICFRLEMAQSMILKTDLPMKSIAMSSGYSDYEHFSKAFMKMYHMSPRAYREHGKKLREK